MKVAVIGPGAMGLLFSAYLKEGGLDVWLLDHLPERAARLKKNGILIEGVRGEHRVKLSVTTDASAVTAAELVIVWVKAYQTRQAVNMHRALFGPETLCWTAQNGVGNQEAIQQIIDPTRVLAGTTTMGAHLVGEGRVRHAAEGDTLLGEPGGGVSERVEKLCRVLSAAGIAARPAGDIHRAIWEKLVVNAAINPLTALLKVPNGRLIENAAALRLMRALVREVVQAARVQGVELDEEACVQKAIRVAESTAGNRSSMLQDREAGRRTEIDFINGAVAALTDAPTNAAIAELIRAVETAG